MSSDSGHLISRASNVIAYKQLGDGERVFADAAYLIIEAAASNVSNGECDVSIGPKESMSYTRSVRGFTVPLLTQGTFDVSRLASALGSRSKGTLSAILITGVQHIRYIAPADFAPGGKLSLLQAFQVVLAVVLSAGIAYSPLVSVAIRSLPNF